MSFSRREMLKLGAGAAALWATGTRPLHAQEQTKKKIPIGLQLYSVRDLLGKDLPGVIEAIGKMGYAGVEFAGYYNRPAKELRKILDANGLKCCGTHTAINTLLGDELAKTIEFNQTLGNKYLIVPFLGGKYMASAQAVKDTAKLVTEIAAKAKPAGMRVGYHAHAQDLQKIGGETHWDIFFSNAWAEVVMQLDTANCLDGGGDPVAILKKFASRAVTIHLKEHGGKHGAPLGEGAVDWKTIFEICETIAPTEWYIVEQEVYAGPPLESVKQCLQNLKKMGK